MKQEGTSLQALRKKSGSTNNMFRMVSKEKLSALFSKYNKFDLSQPSLTLYPSASQPRLWNPQRQESGSSPQESSGSPQGQQLTPKPDEVFEREQPHKEENPNHQKTFFVKQSYVERDNIKEKAPPKKQPHESPSYNMQVHQQHKQFIKEQAQNALKGVSRYQDERTAVPGRPPRLARHSIF